MNAVTEVIKGSKVVTMTDGRQVDFGVRGKLKKSVEILENGFKVAIDCINGDTHVLEIPNDHSLLLALAAHGASQKITDAITKAEEEEDVSLGVANTIQQLLAGQWSQRTQGESVARGFADFLEAVRRVKVSGNGGTGYEVDSPEYATLKKNLLAKSEDEIKSLKANPIVKGLMATIASEKAAARAAKLNGGAQAEAAALDALAGL